MRRKNKNRGSITVEASISLILFVFVMISIISLINICRVQAKVGNALHLAAMDISNVSYLYYLTGMYDLDVTLQQTGSDAEAGVNEHLGKVDKVLAGTEGLLETIGNAGKVPEDFSVTSYQDVTEAYENMQGAIDDVESQLGELKGDSEALLEDMRGIAEDPMAFVKMLVQYGIGKASGAAKNFVAGLFAESLMIEHIEAEETIDNADTYLKSLGVVDGIAGMSFMASSIFAGDDYTDINLVAIYKVKVFPLLTDAAIPFAQSASTRAWLSGDVLTAEKMPENTKEDSGDAESAEEVEDEVEDETEKSAWEEPNFKRSEMIQDEVIEDNKLDESDGFVKTATNSGTYGYDTENSTIYTGNTCDTNADTYRNDDGTLNVDKVTKNWQSSIKDKLSSIEKGLVLKNADGTTYTFPEDTVINVVYYFTVPENITDEEYEALQKEIDKWLASISNPYSDKIGSVKVILRRGGGNS